MKIIRALWLAGCVLVLALAMIDVAQAAIVPFDGTEYSWLHRDSQGNPAGDWKSQISDNLAVRSGDSMQFQNRWYNGYAGTADARISYGGGQPYVCTGAEETVFYGLNYGNYYPSGTASVPLYTTALNCSEEPNHVVVNHQYVYNGLVYGSFVPTDRWTMQFHRATPEELAAFAAMTPEQRNATAPAAAPPEKPADVPAATPTEIPVVHDLPTPAPAPAEGFSPIWLIGLAFALAAGLLVILVWSGKQK